MSTLEAEIEDAVEEQPFEDHEGDPDILAMGEPSVEVGVEESEMLAIADAEHEGMPPAPEKSPVAESLANAEAEADWSKLFELRQFVQNRQGDVEVAAKEHKNAKAFLESAQDTLTDFIEQIEARRKAKDPDPAKFPLFDKAKEEINATFAKPEAIAPLPADTEEEFFRRKRMATKLDTLGLKPKALEILVAEGCHTVEDVQRTFYGGGRSLATIKNQAGSMTEARIESLNEAIADAAVEWGAEWDRLRESPESSSDESTEAEPEAAEPDAAPE